jgi:hypothetical protein
VLCCGYSVSPPPPPPSYATKSKGLPSPHPQGSIPGGSSRSPYPPHLVTTPKPNPTQPNQGIHVVDCRLQAHYPSRSIEGVVKLTRGSQGVICSFWPADTLDEGEEPGPE